MSNLSLLIIAARLAADIDSDIEVKLAPGVGFHLQLDGKWKPESIPGDVIRNANLFGHLTINGARCTIFITPDGDQWAQKSVGTPNMAPSKTSSKIAALLTHKDTRNTNNSHATEFCWRCGNAAVNDEMFNDPEESPWICLGCGVRFDDNDIIGPKPAKIIRDIVERTGKHFTRKPRQITD